MTDVTHILSQIESGDPQAAAQLLPLVYDELRKLAAQKLAQEKPGQTLQATALVHEVYLRLVGDQRFDNRGHFFATAAEAMRRILLERARQRGRLKRGGDRLRLELLDHAGFLAEDPDLTLSLEESLTRLEAEDAIAAKSASLHLLGGLSVEEAGEVLGFPSPWPTETGSTPGLGSVTPWGSNSRKGETFFLPTAHEEYRNSPYQISIVIHFGVQNE